MHSDTDQTIPTKEASQGIVQPITTTETWYPKKGYNVFLLRSQSRQGFTKYPHIHPKKICPRLIYEII